MKRFVWSIVLMAVTLIMCGCEKDYYEAAPEEMITYISTDGKAIKPRNDDLYDCDTRVIANFYQDGVGHVLFDKPVTYVGGLFYNQGNLLSITLPYGVKFIGDSAFSGCNSLTSVTIPNSVTEIGYSAFEYCASLTSVTIPNSVTEIEGYAFEYCTSLKSVTIPNSVTEIGYGTFSNCTSLEHVNIPSIMHVNSGAFECCSSLKNVTFGDGVKVIGHGAFVCCSTLKSVIIGKNVESIELWAFSECPSLTSVYCKPTTPPTVHDNSFESYVSGRKIYVPRASVDKYKSADGWSKYASDIVGYDF